jgi:hypothetical protein
MTRAEAAAYFARFDAIVESAHMSNATYNRDHKALLSWYLDGVLQLKGFFFARINSELSYLLFQTQQPGGLAGFALKGTELYRFAGDEHGAYEFDALVTPLGDAMYRLCTAVEASHFLFLPKQNEAEAQQVLLITLSQVANAPADRPLPPGSSVVQRTRGNLFLADKRLLVDKLRREDPPMRFVANVADMPRPGGAAR